MLKVREPKNNCNVYLVGVTHGNPSSAALVEEIVSDKSLKPSVVVLELCEDRYMSYSLQTKIRPWWNEVLGEDYDKRLARIEEIQKGKSKGARVVSSLIGDFNFIRKQGLLVGSFMSFGILVAIMQMISKSTKSRHEDEFGTAIQVCHEMDIPMRLGDAPQLETLNSIKKVVSFDTLNPKHIMSDAKSFAFAAFGITFDSLPWVKSSRYQLVKKQLDVANWINVPNVYLQNKVMFNSLMPLFAFFVFYSSLGMLPASGDAMFPLLPPLVPAEDVTQVQNFVETFVVQSGSEEYVAAVSSLAKIYADSVNSGWMGLQYLVGTSPPPETQITFSAGVNTLAMIVLVRLAKLIGADRDRFIADKVQDVCREFPVRICYMITIEPNLMVVIVCV